MNDVFTVTDELENLLYKKEKAEFNDNPTEEVDKQIQDKRKQLIDQLQHYLSELVPRQLPPLEINNPRHSLETDINDKLIDIIENIGLEEEDDSDLLVELNGNNQSHHELIIYLASWYIYHEQPEEAAGYLRELVEHNPAPVVYYNLSYALAVQNILTPALDYLDEIPSDQFQAEMEHNKAVIYDRLGRYEEAQSHFKAAVDQSSDPELHLFNWGLSAKGFGRLEESKMVFTQLQKTDPDYPGMSYHLGDVNAQQGNYADAIDSFLRAHYQDPDNLIYLADLATACLMGKRYIEAIDYYKKYLKSDTSVSVLNNLGAAYLKTNQFEEAAEVLDQAVKIDPENEQSRRNLDIAKSYLE